MLFKYWPLSGLKTFKIILNPEIKYLINKELSVKTEPKWGHLQKPGCESNRAFCVGRPT